MVEVQGSKIKITEKMRQQLVLERARTQVGQYKLLRLAQGIPAGLGHRNVEDWMRGFSKSAIPQHFEFVMDEYRSKPTKVQPTKDMLSPDYDWKSGTWKKPDKTITEADLQLLEAELERTGAMWRVIFHFIPDRPKQLNSTLMSNIRNKRQKTVKEEYWQMVINGLKTIPDKG